MASKALSASFSLTLSAAVLSSVSVSILCVERSSILVNVDSIPMMCPSSWH